MTPHQILRKGPINTEWVQSKQIPTESYIKVHLALWQVQNVNLGLPLISWSLDKRTKWTLYSKSWTIFKTFCGTWKTSWKFNETVNLLSFCQTIGKNVSLEVSSPDLPCTKAILTWRYSKFALYYFFDLNFNPFSETTMHGQNQCQTWKIPRKD